MIKKINKIKDFGIYSDYRFAREHTPEFKKFNLIYGWNYSGKTTLSRIFRSFELKDFSSGFELSEFEIEGIDGNKFSQTNLVNNNLPIRVFNSDFIEDNLKWTNEAFNPIFILGEENIETQNNIEYKKKVLERLKRFQSFHNKNSSSIIKNLNKKKTDESSRIKNDLLQLVEAFGKTQIEKFINKINETESELDTFILDEENYNKEFDTYHSKNMKKILNENIDSSYNFSDLIEKTKDFVSEIIVYESIEELKNNPLIERWVKTGIELHTEEKEVCKFCKNPISSELWNELGKHFTQEKTLFEEKVNKLILDVENRKIKLNIEDEANIYDDKQELYLECKNFINEEVEKINSLLESLIISLKDKLKKLEEKEVFDIEIPTNELNTKLEILVNYIKENNETTNNYAFLRDEAKRKLIYHYTAKFMDLVNYNNEIEKSENEDEKIKKAEILITTIDIEIKSLESEISESLKGAEKINEYLKIFFTKEDIKIEPTESEDNYQLKRYGQVAKNLSEGEKTAISFAYFMANLENKDYEENSLNNMIIYLDDPISSLDSNHLINVYAFIKRVLNDAKQIFISTHNFEFFNLIKDWFSEKNNSVNQGNRRREQNGQEPKPLPCEFFMIKNKFESDKRIATITELEKTLKDFKSEYQYLYYLLYEFNQKDDFSISELYQINNIARRFIELFATFKIPRSGDWKGKIEKILADNSLQVDIEKVYKLTNTYSHQTNPMSVITHIDKVEAKSGLKILFEIIEKSDKMHFDALQKHCENLV
ncbi:AAA family ATPase [Arcobacter sp. KX21116]|uniref:AAA family ATPase n=1 Tax=Arcobacter iocasae TaxID=2906515 RepID=UPI0035D45E10